MEHHSLDIEVIHSENFFRVYPGSEFVAASTLAKWKTLEPNETNFSQGFSQKVENQQVVF